MTEAIQYHEALDELRAASEALLKDGAGVIFTTQCRKKLGEQYLRAMANAAKELNMDVNEVVTHFRCSTCSRFMARVGHLVISNPENPFAVRSVFWNPAVVTDPLMKLVVAEMKRYVESARIQNVYNVDGPYKQYTEVTNLGGKEFRHYFIPQAVLTHRVPVLNNPISIADFSKKFDQVAALIRFTGEVSLDTVMYVDGLFQARMIEHVGASEKTMGDLKALLASLQVAKSTSDYGLAQGDYNKETILVNTIWMAALRNMNMLSIRGSILGKLLAFTHDALAKGAREAQLDGIKKFWATQTDGLHYQRTTREASESQLSKTARFLEEGGWNESLKQVEAAELDLPVLWQAKEAWTFEEGHKAISNDFAAFAAKKGVELNDPTQPKPIDLGYFINEVLPFVESMGFVATGLTFMPILVNRMANLEAKPIFVYDTLENRAPFIPWRYDRNYSVRELNPLASLTKNGETVLPVLSITSDSTIGYKGRRPQDNDIFFQFGGISMPQAPRPALFAESMDKQFYEHRRAIEDYCRNTIVPRSETQQSISMVFGPRHPQDHSNVFVLLHVRFGEEGKARFGATNVTYRFDARGYTVQPDLSKFEVIRDRTKVAVTEPTEAPKVPTAEVRAL
ncbi:hypothetical protein PA10_00285 [Pseudomonas phage pPa_SNUABM_DT01]|nr:hypothetical protein PA10_00285 [Pseudomonas phage pPa_SNUABM_DT01]